MAAVISKCKVGIMLRQSYDEYKHILTDGKMHHYALSYDRYENLLYMYLDSVNPIATACVNLDNAVSAGDTGLLLIGSHNGNSSYEVWNGLIDRIRFSDNVVLPEDFIPVPEPAAICLFALGWIALRKRGR